MKVVGIKKGGSNMMRQFRYQTGELDDIIKEMKDGKIPSVDVDDSEEMNWVINQLESFEIFKAEDIPHDRNARDKVKESEFEFRVAFYYKENLAKNIKYIDFFFEPEIEESYPQIGFD